MCHRTKQQQQVSGIFFVAFSFYESSDRKLKFNLGSLNVVLDQYMLVMIYIYKKTCHLFVGVSLLHKEAKSCM